MTIKQTGTRVLLKSTLILVGVIVMLLGLNTGLGGIQTLGWQISGTFLEITDRALFGTNDSHIRFLGGVWFGVGVAFLIGGYFLEALRPTLIALCSIVALAGLFRFSGMITGTEPDRAIWISLALEILGFPCLAWWLSRS